MAATFSSSINQLKQDFCNQYPHLSEQERQQLWIQHVGALPCSPSDHTQRLQAPDVPRSISNNAATMTQLLVNSYGHMDRVQSTPAMEQSMPTSQPINIQRSNSNMPSWSSSFEDQPNAYALFSDASMSRQQTFRSNAFSDDVMVEYSPADYINMIEPSNSALPLTQHHSNLQLTPQWMPSLEASTAPSTPSTAQIMTPVTLSSNLMSRQSSFNSHFMDDVPMFRSDSSMYDTIPQDGSSYFPHHDVSLVQKNISALTDTPLFPSTSHGLTALGSQTPFFAHAAPVSVPSPSVNALASTPRQYQDNEMQRSTSSASSSESDSSSASSLNRSRRREREIIAQAKSRELAPKSVPAQSKSASPNAHMTRIQSEDGSSKQVGILSKVPYQRPQHPKILCPHCTDRAEGFRGTHELDRHIARAHSARRKGFICVAPDFNKNFLNNCKHCRNQKVYGAYYNAAAHLRRAHFHPRIRGHKGKKAEKRGGIGGGDHPAMDYLKQHWIQEIEVENTPKTSSSSKARLASPINLSTPEPQTPESTVEHDFNAADDAAFEYPTPQTMPADVSMVAMGAMDPSQYVDFAAYSNMDMIYATPQQQQQQSTSEFDFDAYRTQ